MAIAKRLLLAIPAVAALLFSGPLLMLASDDIRFGVPWHESDRSATDLAPAPSATPQAVVQVYSARAYNWRGLFAVHTWVATKPADADAYTVHHVTAWNRPVISSRRGQPDRRWMGATPQLLADLRGPTAARAIEQIAAALPDYPYPRYRAWPGPNSNTFTAWLIRAVPSLDVELPSTAIGKDYLGDAILARTPSDTGWQLSLHGLAGVLVGEAEGIEINLFGLVWGLDPASLAIKWPGLGRIGWPASPAPGEA